ncbi:hypothetical protein J7E79_28955 [Bacillus sp. ISL-40]|uniref:hypothetical protein n=1 Tax=unclassified Bacillus (in: firmicutes) TaxID=185979 RepID=UPI001BEB3E5B|nr:MULTISPECIES: hypothetical protein [unclassified Bacillus (in: firmicutes)]MBT2701294.1 hypothetical protein [Bacillus sp. ISL-40]MBT2722817.1 hypothetical protein [Bacillus sp. ISL-46]MBT2744777.1 hypothetical protein [Bacillus sp. ISL-77]
MNSKMRIDGFRMHHAILEEFRFLRDESFERPPASAYVVYMTMLKQLEVEQNQRGMLKEYNLSSWAKKLGISYSTLWGGKRFLEDHHFVKEEIHEGLPVLVLKDVEKYNTPEHNGGVLNYLIIPHGLFDTNILAEFVRTSNPEGIELLLSLLNQFRTGMSFSKTGEVEKVKQERTMKTLKFQLNKNAKGVRKTLSVLEALFSIEFTGIEMRGKQIWIKKVGFSLKPECVEENTDEFNVNPLMAKLSKELTYFLDGHQIKYKPRDQIDVMLSFKQEVMNKMNYLLDEDREKFTVRDRFIKNFFIETMDQIGVLIHTEKQRTGTFHFYSIGAFFRMAFRKYLPGALKKLPYDLIFEAKIREFTLTGQEPALYNLI